MMTQMIRSKPVRVRWAGWESDTYTLQRNGWTIKAEQHVYDRSMSIAIKHRDFDAYGVSDTIRPDRLPYEHQRSMDWLAARGVSFRMSLANHIQVGYMGEMPNFRTIDSTPMVDYEERIMGLEELQWFHPIPENEVVVQPPSFDEILTMALDHQAPKQKELREKARRDLQTKSAIIRVAA